MMLVKAGKPVDEFIDQLIPHLDAGDIIIDGGNSLFNDTNRRQNTSRAKACSTSVPASVAAKKVPGTAPASCPADPRPPGPM